MVEIQISTDAGIDYVFKEDNFVWELRPKKPTRVILSVAHDGLPSTDFLGLTSRAKWEDSHMNLENGLRDTCVWAIAKKIAGQVPVSVVRGMLPRSEVDYNAPWSDEADKISDLELRAKLYPNAKLEKTLWTSYYYKLDSAISRSIDDFGYKDKVVLLDLHGIQQCGWNDIVLGTDFGQTVKFGNDKCLEGYLREEGACRVYRHDAVAAHYHINSPYQGGNIIKQCHRNHEVDCIQVEIEAAFRNTAMVHRMNRLVDAFVWFIKSLT